MIRTDTVSGASSIPISTAGISSWEERQSKVVNFLRFPLIICVVILHNPVSIPTGAGFFFPLVGQLLSNLAVPLFFLISGYYFFYKTEFNKTTYIQKIKKRALTLFLPYMIWITAWLVIYYVLTHGPLAGKILGKGQEYSLGYVFNAFWSSHTPDAPYPLPGNPRTYPVLEQLWFIRDLMVLFVLSPILYFCTKRLGIWFVCLLGVAWLCNLRLPWLGDRGVSHTALFFVSLGAWFAIHGRNFVKDICRTSIYAYVAYPAFILFWFVMPEVWQNSFIFRLGVLLGMLFSVNLVTSLMDWGAIKAIPFLTSASFFVYAFHQPWLLLVFKRLFLPSTPGALEASPGMAIFYYVLFPLFILAICLPIYGIMRRFTPRLSVLATGGR